MGIWDTVLGIVPSTVQTPSESSLAPEAANSITGSNGAFEALLTASSGTSTAESATAVVVPPSTSNPHITQSGSSAEAAQSEEAAAMAELNQIAATLVYDEEDEEEKQKAAEANAKSDQEKNEAPVIIPSLAFALASAAKTPPPPPTGAEEPEPNAGGAAVLEVTPPDSVQAANAVTVPAVAVTDRGDSASTVSVPAVPVQAAESPVSAPAQPVAVPVASTQAVPSPPDEHVHSAPAASIESATPVRSSPLNRYAPPSRPAADINQSSSPVLTVAEPIPATEHDDDLQGAAEVSAAVAAPVAVERTADVVTPVAPETVRPQQVQAPPPAGAEFALPASFVQALRPAAAPTKASRVVSATSATGLPDEVALAASVAAEERAVERERQAAVPAVTETTVAAETVLLTPVTETLESPVQAEATPRQTNEKHATVRETAVAPVPLTFGRPVSGSVSRELLEGSSRSRTADVARFATDRLQTTTATVPAHAKLVADASRTEIPQSTSVRSTESERIAAGGSTVTQVIPERGAVGQITAAELAATPSSHTEIVQQVTQAVAGAWQDQSTVRVQLAPPELGPLQVDLQQAGTGVSARLEVQSAETHRLMVESLPQLRESLAERGVTVDRLEIVLNEQLAGQTGDFSQGQQQQSAYTPDDVITNRLFQGGRSASRPAAAPVVSPPVMPALARRPQLMRELDIRV